LVEITVKNRQVRIAFRSKQARGAGAVKVFTNVRLPGVPHPRQLHLGYLARTKFIPRLRRTFVEERLREHWEALFRHRAVEIDWLDAEKKWGRRDMRKRARPVNRILAGRQLAAWLRPGPVRILREFGGNRIAGDDDHSAYCHFYRLSPRFVAAGLRDLKLDLADLTTWWTERELPRLLQCYFRYVGRKANYHFTRNGFVTYAAINIEKGYALSQYLRFRPPAGLRSPAQLFIRFQEEEIRRRLGAVKPLPSIR
jgi:hypothetical protein